MTKVVNLHHKVPYDVYIGRPGRGQDGPFGNPYTVKDHGSNAIPLFKRYLEGRTAADPGFREQVQFLRGKILGCFCSPKGGFQGKVICHGQIIAAWLDGVPPESIE